MILPSLIIIINNNFSENQLQSLKTQLFIHEVINSSEFNNRIVVQPSYIQRVRLNNLRIMIILDDFYNYNNRQYADIVMNIKNGLGFIEKNNFGPPGQIINLNKINIFNIINYKS